MLVGVNAVSRAEAEERLHSRLEPFDFRAVDSETSLKALVEGFYSFLGLLLTDQAHFPPEQASQVVLAS